MKTTIRYQLILSRMSVIRNTDNDKELHHKEDWGLKDWCFWVVVLEKTFKSPLDSKEIKQINPEYSLERQMLKLKLQYFGYLMWRANTWEKTLMLGKIESGRRRRQQRMRWLDGITDSMDMTLSKLWEIVKNKRILECCSPWGHKESDTT